MFASPHVPSAALLPHYNQNNRFANALGASISMYIIILVLIRIMRIMGQKICSNGREGGVAWLQRSFLL